MDKPLCEKYYCHKMLGGNGAVYDTVDLSLAVVCIITFISTSHLIFLPVIF